MYLNKESMFIVTNKEKTIEIRIIKLNVKENVKIILIFLILATYIIV